MADMGVVNAQWLADGHQVVGATGMNLLSMEERLTVTICDPGDVQIRSECCAT